jgi:competence protein ComEA
VEEELHAVVERLRALGSERRWGVVLLAFLAAAAGVAWVRAGAHAATAPPPGTVPIARSSGSSASSVPAFDVVVDVVGAVRHPGLQHMANGTRIADAIAAAGGAQHNADIEQLNLAARLVDGERVVVPRLGEVVPAIADPGSSPDSSAAAPVDLNTATADQLDALPGIGPATADAIIRDREAHGAFHSVDDLARVRGIGPAKLDQLRDLVTV